jgi:hypothetical protein
MIGPVRREHLVQVAFEADKKFLGILGDDRLKQVARRTWASLSADQRAKWIDTGPEYPAIRQRLYEAILEAIGELDVGNSPK